MVKLSANVSKKVPMPDVEFSSRCCSAGIEVELAASDSKDILAKLKQLYATLEVAVDEQLSAPRTTPMPRAVPEEAVGHPQRVGDNGKPRATRGNHSNGNGKGNGKNRPASDAQVRAIEAIARDRGIIGGQLVGLIVDRFGTGNASELTIAEASSLIDELKNGNGKH